MLAIFLSAVHVLSSFVLLTALTGSIIVPLYI